MNSSTLPSSPGAQTHAGPDATLSQAVDQRDELIREIRRYNATAAPEFLSGFSLLQLNDYLDHLRHARQKHIRLPGWVQRRTAALSAARRSLKKVA